MFKDLIIGLIAIIALTIFLHCLFTGFDKSLDIRDSLSYDAETGRMIYLEKGV